LIMNKSSRVMTKRWHKVNTHSLLTLSSLMAIISMNLRKVMELIQAMTNLRTESSSNSRMKN
jgi:hypothetical protein